MRRSYIPEVLISPIAALLLAGFFTLPTYAGELSQTPQARAERKLAEDLNGKCRGGSGDDPITMRACDERGAAFAAVERNQGRCWNPRSVDEVEAWPACPSTQPKALSPFERAKWEDQAFYAWQDTQRCAYDTTMAFARQGTYGAPALRAAQGMCSGGKLPVILTILEGEYKAKEATALAVEQGYRRAANRLEQ